jgi:predicted dehydrogenase
MSVNIGVIGCGRWGLTHLSTLATLKNEGVISKIFACDTEENKSLIMPSEVDAFFTNWQDMIEAEQLDIIAVVTPPDSHEDISMKLLNQGINLLVEKPLATSFIGATSLLAASQTNGRILSVGYLLRFHSAINLALEKISSGLIGVLERMEFTRITTRAPSKYTDVFQALGIHGLDTACYCFGELEPERVHLSKVQHSSVGKAISAEIIIEFAGHREVNIITAWGGEEEQSTIQFFGEKGILHVDMNNHKDILCESKGELYPIKTKTQQLPLELEWLHMIAMLKGTTIDQKRSFPSHGAILRGVRLIEKITDYAQFEYDNIHDKTN